MQRMTRASVLVVIAAAATASRKLARELRLTVTMLSEGDRDRLSAFFQRALELHASGAVTTESIVDYFMLAIGCLDQQTDDALEVMRELLEDAWREDDA